MTNFVFTKNPAVSGEELYLKLKARGILVRHFNKPRLTDYIRVTIGSREEMAAFVGAIKEILEDIQ
jgi:histidinol-phosphate aminotransferase